VALDRMRVATILPVPAMEELLSFVTSAMDTGELSDSLTCCFAPGKELRGLFRTKLGGPQNRSVRLAGFRAKSSSLLPKPLHKNTLSRFALFFNLLAPEFGS
jgi:hypothetical protein